MTPISLIEKAFLLKKSELFEDLDLDLLLAIADKVDSIHLEEGKHLFCYGQSGGHLFLLTKGSLQILSKEEEELARLSAGATLGDEALFSENPRQYSCRCLSACEFLALSRSNLFAIISESPSVAIRLLHLYTKEISFRKRK